MLITDIISGINCDMRYSHPSIQSTLPEIQTYVFLRELGQRKWYLRPDQTPPTLRCPRISSSIPNLKEHQHGIPRRFFGTYKYTCIYTCKHKIMYVIRVQGNRNVAKTLDGRELLAPKRTLFLSQINLRSRRRLT